MGGLLTASLRRRLLSITLDRLFLVFSVDSIGGQIVASFLIQQFFSWNIIEAERHKIDDEEERGYESEGPIIYSDLVERMANGMMAAVRKSSARLA